MITTFKELLLRFLHVPAAPTPPAGSPESVRTFRASRRLLYLNLLRWGSAQLAALAGIVIFFAVESSVNLRQATVPVRILELFGLVSFLVQLPFTFLFVLLDYDLRWYIVTDRSLRIRYGLLNVREMTMAFANIQQTSLQQGPLQRLLGIADLEVRSAGGGSGPGAGPHGGQGGGHSGHLGYFRGVDNAEEVRDLILARLRQWRDAGLGDPEEQGDSALVSEKSAESEALLSAAKAMLEEAKALRADLTA